MTEKKERIERKERTRDTICNDKYSRKKNEKTNEKTRSHDGKKETVES